MSKIFWDNKEIPLPENSHIDRTDGRVFIYLNEGKPIRQSRKVTVGHATSETTMHPNTMFRQLFPNLWEQYYGEVGVKRHVKRCGMYALALGAGWASDLYPLLCEIYGPKTSNLVMDYSMYSIMHHTNVAQTFGERMSDEVIFSERLPGENQLSGLFRDGLDEEATFCFRDAWLDKCAKDGLSRVWLAVDGSNNDCDVSNSEPVEHGKAKSRQNSGLVSYMYAVDAESGRPVTYLAYNGGKVDVKAIQSMIVYLKGHGISVAGLILDRAFCSSGVLETLVNNGYEYIVLLKSGTKGHVDMMSEYATTIRWNVKNLVGLDGLFGISSRKRLFKNSSLESNTTLFFDGKNGSERSITLMNKVLEAATQARSLLATGRIPEIPPELEKYIRLQEVNGNRVVCLNSQKLQTDVDVKGYSTIASSLVFSPSEVNRIFHLRDTSEKQYMIMKTQLGNAVTRVHSTSGIMGTFAACFIASILRHEILEACRRNKFITNKMLSEIDRLILLLNRNDIYSAVHDETARQKALLATFDILPEDLDAIAGEYNGRENNPVHSQIRLKPSHENSGKRRVGRPKGSVRKRQTAPANDKPKRGKGRPKGSLNKKTIERLENQVEQPMPEKRKKGRPKGSKNKPKYVVMPKRGRGRPRGSKNKTSRDSGQK